MNKQENEQMAVMCEFIARLYMSANLEVPESFDPEEQVIIISNALKNHGRTEMATCLLRIEKDEVERAKLKELIDFGETYEDRLHHNHV